MNTYKVTYDLDGGRNASTIEAVNAGQAFAKCQAAHTGAKMVKAMKDGSWKDGYGKTEWQPPPVQRDPVKEPRPFHAPKRDDKEGVMPFYDEVVNPES